MLFPTVAFATFFAVVYPICWWLRARARTWQVFVLGASYVFYGFWDWRFVGLIVLSTAFNQSAAVLLARDGERGRRVVLIAGLVFNIGLLGGFKYYGFFVESFNDRMRDFGLSTRVPVVEVLIPVGISFFTFQAISYVVDVYRRSLRPGTMLEFAVYLAFFPHLVAGPIVRAAEFLPQLARPRMLSSDDASRAALMIGRGLFKKVVISSFLATSIVDPVFGAPEQHSSAEILVATFGYAVQIYADFSGYTDMAIGIALLLGIRFPQNFDRPYAASSLQDFWHRWHITLSRWLRDYLYIPLGGNRHGRLRTYANLILTMVLGGLWHGAAWTFVVWGLFHGLGLTVERGLVALRGERGTGAVMRVPLVWLGPTLTFLFVCAGWVFFRADSMETALTMFARLVTAWGPAPLLTPGLVAVIVAAIAVQHLPAGLEQRLEATVARVPLVAHGAALGLFIALTFALGPSGVAPFIYYQF
jgi:D-alanyl-lipoteichoic acid acyltransferase DltB (MBOAT superfamily)